MGIYPALRPQQIQKGEQVVNLLTWSAVSWRQLHVASVHVPLSVCTRLQLERQFKFLKIILMMLLDLSKWMSTTNAKSRDI